MTSAATLGRLPTAISADTGGNVTIAGNVGIGTTATTGMIGNTITVFGNIQIANASARTSGIFFADGTFQSTAGGGGSGTGNYSNTNVASYLSGPVLIGNLWIANTTISTSTTTGSLVSNGGAGIAGNLNVGGNIVTTGTSGNITGVNDLSTVTVTTTGNVRINTLGTGIVFPDNTFLGTASLSYGLPGTIQYAGTGNTLIGNSDALFWDAANSRLGIGTSVPFSALNVVATSVPLFQTSNSQIGGNNFEILVGNSSSTGTTLGYVNNTTVPYGYISTGASTRTLTVAANGRVGIGGVTAPQNTFEVSGIAVVGALWAGNSTFINPPTNGLAVQGRVGVGTYTPLSTLDVNGVISGRGAFNVSGSAAVASLTSNGDVSGTTGSFTSTVTGTAFIPTGSAAPSNGMYLPSVNTLAFATNTGQRITIGSTGLVGIGSSSPNGYQLDVNTTMRVWNPGNGMITMLAGDATHSGYVEFHNNNNTRLGYIGYLDYSAGFYRIWSESATNSILVGTNNTEALRIEPNGNISTTGANATTGYNLDVGGSVRVAGGLVATGEVTAYFSDERLKANITAITNAVDKVMAINGVYYNANDLAVEIAGEDKTIQRVGLLAQEVEAIMPQIVKAAPFDIGDNGISKSGEHYKTLQYERLVPLLVEAIKEQQKTIDDLVVRVARLEGNSN